MYFFVIFHWITSVRYGLLMVRFSLWSDRRKSWHKQDSKVFICRLRAALCIERDLALKILEGNWPLLVDEYRFESSFTEELCRLLRIQVAFAYLVGLEGILIGFRLIKKGSNCKSGGHDVTTIPNRVSWFMHIYVWLPLRGRLRRLSFPGMVRNLFEKWAYWQSGFLHDFAEWQFIVPVGIIRMLFGVNV